MAQVSGIIQEIQTRKVAGGKTAYNIVVAGESYGAGLYAPKASVGDYVTFELDDSNGYKNVGRNSLKVSANKPPVEAVEQAKKFTPVDQNAKQDIISRQSATNSAIEYLKVAQAAGLLPATTASAKKGAGLEVLDTLLLKYTTMLYEQNTGVVWKDISPSGREGTPSDEQSDGPDDEPWQ